MTPSHAPRLLHEDAYCTVHLDAARGLVRYVRNATRFPDVDAARQTFEALVNADIGRADLLMTDVRNAPGNNSPEFERLLEQMTRGFFRRFRRRAVLVRSVAGKLQIERLARSRQDEDSIRVYQDEEQALAWLG